MRWAILRTSLRVLVAARVAGLHAAQTPAQTPLAEALAACAHIRRQRALKSLSPGGKVRTQCRCSGSTTQASI